MFDFILVVKIAMLILSGSIFACLYRAILGPTVPDRIIGINVVGTKALVMFIFVGVIFDHGFFFDLAFIYALLLFITSLAFVKYLEYGRLDK